MDVRILSVLIQEGAHLVAEYMRNRPIMLKDEPMTLEKLMISANGPNPDAAYPPPLPAPTLIEEKPIPLTIIKESEPAMIETPASVEPGKAASIVSGCIPCSMGHVGTCSGLLNEAVRFARKDGVANAEVVDRVNMCLDELNSMERVDMRPELISQLKDWEKDLAQNVLVESRNMRHDLENLANTGDVDALEALAAKTDTTRKEIGRQWFQRKLQNMTPAEKQVTMDKVLARIQQMADTVSDTDMVEETSEDES